MHACLLIAIIGSVVSGILHMLTFTGANLAPNTVAFLFMSIGVPITLALSIYFPFTQSLDHGTLKRSTTTPSWIKYASGFLAIYLVFNFLYCRLQGAGSMVNFVFSGDVFTSSEDLNPEKQLQNLYTMRLFSGLWIFFYGVSALICHCRIYLFPSKRRR